MSNKSERVTCYLCDGLGRIGDDIWCWICSDGTVSREEYEKHLKEVEKVGEMLEEGRRKLRGESKKQEDKPTKTTMGNKPRMLDI